MERFVVIVPDERSLRPVQLCGLTANVKFCESRSGRASFKSRKSSVIVVVEVEKKVEMGKERSARPVRKEYCRFL